MTSCDDPADVLARARAAGVERLVTHVRVLVWRCGEASLRGGGEASCARFPPCTLPCSPRRSRKAAQGVTIKAITSEKLITEKPSEVTR